VGGQLQDRVALVTGAGQGIGLGIAEAFAREGATVVIGELEPERGQAAAESLRQSGHRAEWGQLDVTRPESSTALVQRVVKSHGRLDVLVNNAGVFVLERSEESSEASWRFQVDVILNGTFYCSQAAARSMIPQGGGSIVSIASIGGMGGWPLRAAYNAAKAGVIALTEVLATEWAQHGIRVNSISPGVTRTQMTDRVLRDGSLDLSLYERRTPMGRIAEVREMADAVLFLASDRASFVTGTNLRVDGGWVPWGNPVGPGFPQEEAG
jgi:NAD(P)-dependent dehydrogenase (short-subunit alcohol dehydrogenase family)